MNPLLDAAGIIFTPGTVFYMLIGVAGGLIVGAIPGLTATMAMAIITPLTFTMGGNQAFALLCAVYVGAISGGLYSAVLLRIPGTSSSIATTFDGFPLARQGLAGQAIGAGLIASFIGGSFSFVCLTTIAPLLSRFALKFGPHEYFAVSVLGLSTIASVIQTSTIKGLIAGLLGLIASTVGLDRVVGVHRFTFGSAEFTSGFDILAVLIGMFAIPQILSDVGKKQTQLVELRVDRIMLPLRRIATSWFNFLRSSAIGTWIGLLPGAGGSVASLLAYDQARRASRHPETFGTGEIEGVIASESANNGVVGGSIIPLLTLGIPGDTPAAVMLSALMIHGLQPGPLLFRTNPDAIYSILLSLYVANIFMIFIAFFGAKFIIRTLSVNKSILLPVIVVMCVIGTFATNNRMFDVWVMIFSGLIGYVMEKYNYPVGPAVLGLVLGPIVETNLRQAIQISNIGFIEFLTRPISGIVLLLVALNFLWPLIRDWKSKRKRTAKETGIGRGGATMLRINRAAGMFLIVLSFLLFWQSGNIAQTSIESTAYGPSFYPRVLSIFLFVLSLLLLIFPRQDACPPESETGPSASSKKFWTTASLIVAYPLLVPGIGFVVTTVGYLMFSFLSLGDRSRASLIRYLLLSLSTALGLYYIFENFFNVLLPHGLLI